MRGPAVEIDRIVREVLAALPAGSAAVAARQSRNANRNGTVAPPHGPVVHPLASAWSTGCGRGVVITLRDLDGRLDGQVELVVPEHAIVTPLAREHLKERGVALKHASAETQTKRAASEIATASTGGWGYVILDSSGSAEGAIQAVARQGMRLTRVSASHLPGAVRACAEGLAAGTLWGAILFCDDAALAACAANKRPGVRAAVADSPRQVARTVETLAANVLVVEPTERTLHELRNIVRTFCRAAASRQPAPNVVELLGDR